MRVFQYVIIVQKDLGENIRFFGRVGKEIIKGGNKWYVFKGQRKLNYVFLKLGCIKEN